MDKNRNKTLKKSQIIFILCIIFIFWAGLILLATANWIHKAFGEVFLDAVLFTISSPVDGDATKIYRGQALRLIGYQTLKALIFGVVLFLLAWRQTRFTKILDRIMMAVGVVVFIWALYSVNDRFEVIRYFTDKTQVSRMIDDNYVSVNVADAVFPEKKRNLIFIMLESVENSYNDPQYFPEPLMPHLAELQAENLSFHAHYQVLNTNWSAAGLTAYLFGLPLALPYGIEFNAMEFRKDFLPRAISVLELLEANGYQVILTKGHYASFAGWDKLFEQHAPNAKIYDQRYFRTNSPETYESIPHKWAWGLPDSFIYENTKEVLGELDPDQPFFLLLATVDTHVTYQYESNIYDPDRKFGDNRDTYAAADKLIYQFLQWLQQQPFYENTTVVLVGDHLQNMLQLGPVELPSHQSYKRKIYNVLLNPAISPDYPEASARAFASFDFAPTLLESIGVKLPQRKFGLGVSLFSTEPTLIERIGLHGYERDVFKRSELYNYLNRP